MSAVLSPALPDAPPMGPTLWWTRPQVFLLGVTLPVFVAIVLSAHRVITRNGAGYDSPDFITPGFVALALVCLGALTLAAWIGARLPPSASRLTFDTRALDGLFWITVAAYSIWFGPLAVQQPALVLGALTGSAGATYRVREVNPTIPGLTTAVQFGVTYACLYATKRFSHGERLPARYTLYLAGVLALALFRAIVNSERIALLEIVVPLVVVLARTAWRRPWPLRLGLSAFPLLTIFGSTILFAVFEYNRSWVSVYQYRYDSLLDFAAERLSIYYVSSFNNICGFLARTSWPTFTGAWTFSWAYHMPGLGFLLTTTVAPDPDAFSTFLQGAANKEYNNSTGILTALADWGEVGGVLFLLALGFVVGRGYRSYASGRGAMQYVYPVLFYHLYELLRIGYIYDGRGIAPAIGVLVAVMVWGRRPGSEPTQHGAAEVTTRLHGALTAS